MQRGRYTVIYLKNELKIKQIEETKQAKENFNQFYLSQKILCSAKKGETNFNEDELLKQIKKPCFKRDPKTYPHYKKPVPVRQSLLQSIGFSKAEEVVELPPPLFLHPKAVTAYQTSSSDPSYPLSTAPPLQLTNSVPNQISSQPPPKTIMRVSDFLSQFTIEKDINSLQLMHLLDIDHDALSFLKKKAVDFVDATSAVLLEKESLGVDCDLEEETVIFFNEKIQELKQNDINMQICIQNLERVDGIRFEKDGARIFFK